MTEQIKQEAVEFNGEIIGHLVRGSLDVPQLAWIAEPADYRETRERRYSPSREDAVAIGAARQGAGGDKIMRTANSVWRIVTNRAWR